MVEKIGHPSEHFALQASRFFGLLAELQLNATWLPFRDSGKSSIIFRSAGQSRTSCLRSLRRAAGVGCLQVTLVMLIYILLAC